MTTTTLKSTLIKRIESINDIAFLNALKVMTDSKVESSKQQLTTTEPNKLAQNHEKYTKCRIFTAEEIENDIDEWFKGK